MARAKLEPRLHRHLELRALRLAHPLQEHLRQPAALAAEHWTTMQACPTCLQPVAARLEQQARAVAHPRQEQQDRARPPQAQAAAAQHRAEAVVGALQVSQEPEAAARASPASQVDQVDQAAQVGPDKAAQDKVAQASRASQVSPALEAQAAATPTLARRRVSLVLCDLRRCRA